MELAGIPCEVIVSNADETITGQPDEQVRSLALRKAYAVANELGLESIRDTAPGDTVAPIIVIAADTLVYIDGHVLGKPNNHDEAFAMLKSLQGRRHTVYTGVALLRLANTSVARDFATKDKAVNKAVSEAAFVDSTEVFFRPLSDEEIYAYIATGEPFDKAGAYGVQERGAVLVDRVEGDFYTVVGLPISKVCRALADMGYDFWVRDNVSSNPSDNIRGADKK